MLRRYVLIFHAGALGDFILSWPLALALARLHPQSRLVYVTHGQKGALAERALGVESSDIESAGWHHLFADADALPEKTAKLLTGAHTIVSFVSDGTDVWSSNVGRLNSQAKLYPIPARPPDDFTGHASDFLLDQLRPHPAIFAATDQILRSILERGIGSRQSDRKTIVIHPGSGSREKCWPLDRFIGLILRLKSTKHPLKVVVGEVEQERLSPEDLARLTQATDVIQPASFVELLDLLKTAHGYIGNDSGPSHLAGILGVPTLALFGPTNPRVWRPVGPKVHTLRHEPLSDLSVQTVLASAATWLKLNV